MILKCNYEFVAKNGKAEFSINLFTLDEVGITKSNVMFITATRIDLETDENGEPYKMMDYTTIFNGLPTPKNLLKVCEDDTDSAKRIIEVLKGEDVFKFAAEYWNFDKDEWEDNLDDSLALYLEKVNK